MIKVQTKFPRRTHNLKKPPSRAVFRISVLVFIL